MKRRSRSNRTSTQQLESRILLDAAPARLIGDVNTGTHGAGISEIAGTETQSYFLSNDRLFVTDGTEAGTRRAAPENMRVFNLVTSLGDRVLFNGRNDSGHGRLWVSDGEQITELHPNVGFTQVWTAALDNRVYFVADDESGSNQLWKTDGTPEGTAIVELDADTRPTSGRLLTAAGSNLFYFRQLQNGKYKLWVSDGTQAGTNRLTEALEDPARVVAVGDRVFFEAEGDTGTESALWVSDGTSAGTVLVTTLGDEAGAKFELNGSLLFTSASNELGEELWISDGTATGTTLLKSFNFVEGLQSGPPEIVAQTNAFAFFASGGQLWRTDGTTNGTQQLRDFDEGIRTIESTGDSLYVVVGGEVYDDRSRLFLVDATGNSIDEVTPLVSETENFHIDDWSIAGDTLHFSADTNLGEEMWISDGTTAGSQLVKDLGLAAKGSNGDWLTEVGDVGFFYADDGVSGTDWWITDAESVLPLALATEQNISDAAEIRHVWRDHFIVKGPGEEPWTRTTAYELTGLDPDDSISAITQVGSRYFFVRRTATNDELWITDLTPDGTQFIRQYAESAVTGVAALNGKLLFFTGSGVAWTSDGTPAGTVKLEDVRGGEDHLIVVGPNAYFLRRNGQRTEIYRTDGTAEGTIELADFERAGSLAFVNDTLFVSARENGLDSVWSIRETADGIEVSDTGIESRYDLVALDNFVCVPNGLRCTDGSDTGWHSVYEGFAFELRAAGDHLYWVANASGGETHLWTSDGSAGSAIELVDLEVHSVGSNPRRLGLVGDTIVFFASTLEHGYEVWGIDLLDYGDAPSPYASRAIDGGASHHVSSLYLGATVNAEPDALTVNDRSDLDDDGVQFPNNMLAGRTNTVTVTASGAGFVDAWIDSNANGTWEAHEQVLQREAVVAGENKISVDIPDGVLAETYARFRISEDGTDGPTGFGGVGEVEDYQVTVIGTGLWIQDGVLQVFGTEEFDKIVVAESDTAIVARLGSQKIEVNRDEVRKIRIRSGSGPDRINVSANVVTLIESGNGDDTILGGSAKDVIRAGNGSDRIFGRGGDDVLLAGGGPDYVSGGNDNDSIAGGAGDDSLVGGSGSDSINGGSHDDLVLGGDGKDQLKGSRGYDILAGGSGSDLLDGGSAKDILIAGTISLNVSLLTDARVTWRSGSYLKQVDALRSHPTHPLNPESIFADGATDTVIGGNGRDWFIFSMDDQSEDRELDEILDLI